MKIMSVELNTVGRCPHCGGVVSNPEGRRLTMGQLAERHADICPGLMRMKRKENA